MTGRDGMPALVFGGSSGIGLAAATSLAETGARVAIASNDAEALRSLAGRFLTQSCDVTDEASVAACVATVAASLGGLRGMVYSAGIQRYGTVVSTSASTWDECLAVNLKGAFLAAKHVVPIMEAGGGGAIVNVSSVQGIACQTDVAAYAASKGGLNALTRAMALDHAGGGIRVNAVCPGSVDTPMLRASAAGVGDVEMVLGDWGQSHPIGRIGRPEEIGRVIAFLLSDDAAFMTGAEIRVDGGLTAGIAVRLKD